MHVSTGKSNRRNPNHGEENRSVVLNIYFGRANSIAVALTSVTPRQEESSLQAEVIAPPLSDCLKSLVSFFGYSPLQHIAIP